MKKKLLLINPAGRKSGFLLSKFTTFPPLSLAYVAAATPDTWEVKILDENFETFQFEKADLVGITAFTSSINRAYEIANIYRRNKTPVIMGGIHVSMMAEEALEHADAVVVGEAEGVWKTIIEDFEKNELKTKYLGPQMNLNEFNIHPRRDLLSPKYAWQPIQTSRGCPFNCNFCSVSKHLGTHYRQRSADKVLREIESIEQRYIMFSDDNLIGYSQESKKRAKKIFQGMIDKKLNKKWWMQTSINSADDEEIIQLAAKAGCLFALIGFESISQDNLKEMKKGINLRIGISNYKHVIDTFHKYGISVLGCFIVGNDLESREYYQSLAEYLLNSGIDSVQLSILTPLPGTRLMEQMKENNRLLFDDFPSDWNKYRLSYVVHKIEGLEPEHVYGGLNNIKRVLYNFPSYQLRLIRSFFRLRNLESFKAVYKLNKNYKKSWRNAHYFKYQA